MGELWSLQNRIYDYQTRYFEYWNNTVSLTGTGRPVDAILIPLGPTLSFKPEGGIYFGYTGVANLLNVTAGVVQISRADAAIDSANREEEAQEAPVSDLDRTIQESCEFAIIHLSPSPHLVKFPQWQLVQ